MAEPVSDHVIVDFIGELHRVYPGDTFTIGRLGDLEIDDNPYLHRTMVEVSGADGLWWITNVGARLAVHLADADGLTRSTLAPGARVPLTAPRSLLTFQAGPTSYELELLLPGVEPVARERKPQVDGSATIGPPSFTPAQLIVILALAEPVLRRDGTGSGHLPTMAEAASRIGWNGTRFSRKIDNVCAKLEAAGVEGLRGGVRNLATNRRQVLVQYAVSTLLVTEADLPKLDEEKRRNAS